MIQRSVFSSLKKQIKESPGNGQVEGLEMKMNGKSSQCQKEKLWKTLRKLVELLLNIAYKEIKSSFLEGKHEQMSGGFRLSHSAVYPKTDCQLWSQ